MIVNIDITNITGTSPYNLFICQNGESICYYIAQVDTLPYNFDIPPPINVESSLLLKIVDSEGCEVFRNIVLPI